MIMKNLRNWILALVAFTFVGALSCTSAVKKEATVEVKEVVEEIDPDSAFYAEDTTLMDDEEIDEGIMEETDEEPEE
jgi:hypothetical protein